MKYYVQVIARNYLKKLPAQIETVRIHPSYLQGLTEGEFKDGYAALVGFMRDLYTGIIDNPSDFGMPLIDIPAEEHENSNCTKSHAKFVAIPRLILAIGGVGILGTDMTLNVNGGEFNKRAKQLKISNAAALLHIFTEYGFEITGAYKKIDNDDEIKIEYPDCRTLTAALKSICEAQNKNGGLEYFYMMTPQLIESETPKIKFGVDDLFHYLSDENRKIAEVLHGVVVSQSNYKIPKAFSGGNSHNIRTCIYTGKKTKKTIMMLKTRDGSLSIKLIMENINGYTDEIMQMPEHIRINLCDNGPPCNRAQWCLPRCIGGIEFEMKGIAYKICRVDGFWFWNLSTGDLPYVTKLLELEMKREK